MNHAQWTEFIQKGRNKADRPFGHDRRAHLRNDGSVVLVLHSTECVRLYPNGTVLIYTGGWDTHTTRQFINTHAPDHVRVYSRKGHWYVVDCFGGHTPPKIQKCRTCHGAGELQVICWGLVWCYSPRCDHEGAGWHEPHQVPCKHGRSEKHPDTPVQCWRCLGNRRYDYGSKKIDYWWDGNPLVILSNGGISEAGIQHGPTHPHALGYTFNGTTWAPSYATIGKQLADTLPGLHTQTWCPECGNRGSLFNMITELNDAHRWTREQIADWLDALDIDLAFRAA